MKLDELRPCDLCKSPVAGKTREGLSIDFHVLTIERHLLDRGAIQRHAGLTQMLGGYEGIAMAMGPNEDMSVPFDKTEVYVCQPCWMDKRLYVLTEEGIGRELPVPEREKFLEGKR